ncbi:glucosaminidase domain-containing protein [Virgibacillus sp. NKC19-3]|uniref:N-acetylglucosaminidase n=1 Tax=Virgibacillus saliphilus TaxID=2831674 RepID=UPI001C9AE80C|nr:glucosaminidase domain-containing protein [Virgibacillus sp. NKC19-3]MBY7141994.1 glucosaminidase domain-containing protein [Virgibacillus sp. NKC19-3]
MNRRSSFNLSAVIITIVIAELVLSLLFIKTDPSFLMKGLNNVATQDYMPKETSPEIEDNIQEGKQDNETAEELQPPSEKEQKTSQAALWDPEIAEGSSYYYVEDDMLWHNVTDDEGGSFIYGPVPDFMSEGEKYYSPNGSTFFSSEGEEEGTAYQYFEILPLNTETSYTAEQLNQYIENHIPEAYRNEMDGSGPLATLGDEFIAAQNQYGVNALYLLAHAIHESAWGSSSIAQTKYNLFGFGAFDSDPYNGAKKFDSYQDGINHVAQYVAHQYQDPQGTHYHGAMLGNKTAGMNAKYATDPLWGQQIAGYMYRIDKALGEKDFGKYHSDAYKLAVSTVNAPLNVRAQPSASDSNDISYNLPSSGAAMIVSGQVSNDDGTWYEIFSDQSNFLNRETAYIYHDGPQGMLSEIVSVAGE